MYDSLLVPVDATAETTRLTERAIALADTWDATVHLLGIVDGPTALNAEATDRGDRVTGARERARRASMRAAERAQRAGVDARRTVRRGVAHTEIVGEARSFDIDLVLLGPPSRETTAGAICSGQVTRQVVDRAECAVLVEQSGTDTIQRSEPAEPVADESTSKPTASTTTRGDSPEDSPLLAGSQ